MQFYYITDESTGIEHNYLIIPTKEEDMERLREHIPTVTCSAIMRNGKPCLIIDFDISKVAIPLDETFLSGQKLGDKLKVGELLTMILTSCPQDKVYSISKKKVTFNVPLKQIIAFTFRYSEEMGEIYTFYQLHKRIKAPESHSQRETKERDAYVK